jgi:hypothetical protein
VFAINGEHDLRLCIECSIAPSHERVAIHHLAALKKISRLAASTPTFAIQSIPCGRQEIDTVKLSYMKELIDF